MGLQRQITRRTGILTAAALSTAMLAGNCPRVFAGVPVPQGQEVGGLSDALVDVELADAPLSQAINLIKKQTGVSIVFVGAQPQTYNRVTVSLKKKPVMEAMNLIALSAGADVWQKDGIYFIGPQGSGPKAAPEPAAPQLLPDENVHPKQPLVMEKIRLLNSEPQSILERLGIQSGPLGQAVQQMTISILRSIANPNPSPYAAMENINNGGSPLREAPNGSAMRNFAAPSAPTEANGTAGNISYNGVGGLNAGGQNNNSAGDQTAHRSADGRDEFGRGGQGFGGRGGFQGGQGGFGGGQGGFGGQGGGLQGGGQGNGAASGLLPEGITNIFGYELDNSIIVRGTPDAIRDLKEIIRFFDVAPKQLLVRAEFVTVSQNDQNSFGINWSFQKVNLQAGVNTGFSTSNTAFITYAAGNLQTQLSWILTTNHGKVVAAPTVTTLNNLPITLGVGQTIPVFISTPVISQNGTVALATNIQPVQVFTAFNVLPRINADNTITLLGQVQIQSVANTVTGPQGETAPVVATQAVTVQRRIHNGETMVIGGLVQKNDTVSQNKVPLLGDLPLIGNLFKSRSVQTNDQDLLVFITPSIIPDRADTSSLRGGSDRGLLAPGAGPNSGPGTTGGGLMP